MHAGHSSRQAHMPCQAISSNILQQQACWTAGQLCFNLRLPTCDAGLQVGVVRQIETAAIKKTSENRNAPFTRELTAVYTRATLEVGLLCKGSHHRRTAGAAYRLSC